MAFLTTLYFSWGTYSSSWSPSIFADRVWLLQSEACRAICLQRRHTARHCSSSPAVKKPRTCSRSTSGNVDNSMVPTQAKDNIRILRARKSAWPTAVPSIDQRYFQPRSAMWNFPHRQEARAHEQVKIRWLYCKPQITSLRQEHVFNEKLPARRGNLDTIWDRLPYRPAWKSEYGKPVRYPIVGGKVRLEGKQSLFLLPSFYRTTAI